MIRDNRNFAYDLRDVCDSREAPGQQLIAQVGMNRRKIIFFSSAGTRLCDLPCARFHPSVVSKSSPHDSVPPHFSFLPRLLNS